MTQFNLKTIMFMFMEQCIIGRRYICACFCEIFPLFVIRNIKFILLVTVLVCATNLLQDEGHVIGCKGGLKNSCRGRLCEPRLFSGINGLSILCQKEDLAGAEPENSERSGRDNLQLYRYYSIY